MAPDADGRQRHRAGASDKLVPRASLLPGPRPGKAMRITAGRHQGLVGTVLEMLPVQEGRSGEAGMGCRRSGHHT
jgi:G patch domain/KOW motif-containing protein